MAFVSGFVDGSGAGLHLAFVQVCAARQQKSHRINRAVPDGLIQRAGTLFIPRIDIRAVIEKQFDNVQLVVGAMQRRTPRGPFFVRARRPQSTARQCADFPVRRRIEAEWRAPHAHI